MSKEVRVSLDDILRLLEKHKCKRGDLVLVLPDFEADDIDALGDISNLAEELSEELNDEEEADEDSDSDEEPEEEGEEEETE